LPIAVATLQNVADALSAAERGAPAEGRRLLAACLPEIAREQAAMYPNEQLPLLSYAAHAAMKCEMWPEATSLLEQTCVLADRLAPEEFATSGDYWKLGVCYGEVGQWDRALLAFRKGHGIATLATAPAEYMARLEALIANAESKLARTSPPAAVETSARVKRLLDRFRRSR